MCNLIFPAVGTECVETDIAIGCVSSLLAAEIALITGIGVLFYLPRFITGFETTGTLRFNSSFFFELKTHSSSRYLVLTWLLDLELARHARK